MIPEVWLYRHDEVRTGRLCGVDVDEADWLWEGCGRNRLAGHNLRTAEWVQIPVPEMDYRWVHQVFALEGKLVLTLGDAPYYLVYNPKKRTCVRQEIPARQPIVRYGTKTRSGKLLLFERSGSKALVLDGPEAEPRVIGCPFDGELTSGWALSDGYVYCPLEDPARVVRFDPVDERFVDENTAPFPEADLAGHLEYEGILYAWDTVGGQVTPVEMETGRWLEPIPTPDHGSLYGSIRGGFGFRGKAYMGLSTYAHRNRLDSKAGEGIPSDGRLTVDGRPLLDRFLVFDPGTGAFGYLTAPEQHDGIPLLCHSWTDGDRFAVTGIVVPHAEPGAPGRIFGPWIVLQNGPATEEPEFGPPDMAFDREAHLARYRRSYGIDRSLYLFKPGQSPPLANLQGAVSHYSPGGEAEIVRRAKKTDRKAYLSHIAETLAREADGDADLVRRVAKFVHHTLYYNPIQVPECDRRFFGKFTETDPLVFLEAHDGRCGHGVTVTQALLEILGIPVRRVQLSHHVVAEATYDAGDHIVDALFFGKNQPQRNGRVLSVDELVSDPYFADAFARECFAYDPELLMSIDGFQVLGFVIGPWGSEPYYSFYLHAEKEHPPTLPHWVPAERVGKKSIRLNWAVSRKKGGGRVEYDIGVFSDRACTEEIFRVTTEETSLVYEVPEPNRMYFVETRAMDDHRKVNPDTWYPAVRSNFVLADEEYGWYGVL